MKKILYNYTLLRTDLFATFLVVHIPITKQTSNEGALELVRGREYFVEEDNPGLLLAAKKLIRCLRRFDL